jgi:protein SCO1
VSARHVGAAIALGVLTWTLRSRAELPPPPPMAAISVEEKLGAQLPLGVHFRSSTGQDLELGGVLGNGKPTLLMLAYNRCTMLCSLVLRGGAELLSELERTSPEELSMVTISIDPRDTVHEAARLQAALLDSAGLPGRLERWPFLVGEKPAIDAVAAQVGFRYAWDERTEQYAHPAVVFAISRTGAVLGYFHGISYDAERVRGVLRGGTASSLGEAISSCFRFEPSATRYGALIGWLLKAGAAGVGVALFILLRRLMRHERAKHARGRP